MQLQTTIIRIHFFEFRFYIVRSFKSDNYYIIRAKKYSSVSSNNKTKGFFFFSRRKAVIVDFNNP